MYIFTDGSSSRKNQSIGAAYVVFSEENSLNYKKGAFGFSDKQARNGLAELLAVYCALEWLMIESACRLKEGEKIIIYSDSQYVVNEINIWHRNQILNNFFNTKNKEIIIHILYVLHILREYDKLNIEFKWIKGHQKEESFEQYGNDIADKTAVIVHKGQSDLPDIENLIEDIKNRVKKDKEFDYIKKWYLGI